MAGDAKSTKPTKSAQTTATTATTATERPPPHRAEEPRRVQEEELSFGKYCWNGEKHELLGRSFLSWLLITIFYLIFFFCLFVFFVMCWYISLAMLSPNEPYRKFPNAIVAKDGPGFTVRPSVDRELNGASTIVWFQTGSYVNHGFWSDQLQNWFKHIPKEGAKGTKECIKQVKLDTKTLLQENATVRDDKLSCLVDPQWFGPCSDVKDPSFGYDRGEPCLLFKLNRVYGWEPTPYKYDEWAKAAESGKIEGVDVPIALAKYVKGLAEPAPGGRKKRQTAGEEDKENGGRQDNPDPVPPPAPPADDGLETITAKEAQEQISKYMFVWCDGEFDYDREALGSFQYYPGPFIPAAYFPYKGQKNYQSPFLMLQLKRPLPGAMISLVCQAYAKNIKNDRDTGVGYTRFQLMLG